MACILKTPGERSKGVVTFTTAEHDQSIITDADVAKRLEAIRDRWIVGLHHNWHDPDFVRNPLFDFSMAGEDDLQTRDGSTVPIVPFDACNFVPSYFAAGGRGERFWDLLYIARPVFFKGFPQFLDTVRELYNQGERLRILCLAPMPPYKRSERKTVLYDVRETVEKMFSPEERKLFNLLTLDFDYPFPLDLPTLAHFYRSSRIFAHFAPDERRCRVAAYAWATGMPVVGTAAVGSLLPETKRTAPAFFEAAGPGDFASRIVEAVAAADAPDEAFAAARAEVSEDVTRGALVSQLARFDPAGFDDLDDAQLALGGLDIRLGRHHGLAAGNNRVDSSVGQLVRTLADNEAAVRAAVAGSDDPEVALAAAG